MIVDNEKQLSWIPHGFNFFNPKATKRLVELKNDIRQLLGGEGYQEITPPVFDYSAIFKLTTRESVQSSTFVTRDLDGENLALRSDLTVQVVKAAATGLLGDKFPMKLAYIQPVFQDHPRGVGNRRETIQAGVEMIGNDSPDRFSELLGVARRTFELSKLPLKIVYGDMRFIECLFNRVPGQARNELAAAFHNRDTARIASICISNQIDPALTQILKEVPLIFGDKAALAELKQLCRSEADLMKIISIAENESGVDYDFSMVHDLSYYTGPVFEGYTDTIKEKIISGGVYDNLFEKFQFNGKGKAQNACGFAINISLLI